MQSAPNTNETTSPAQVTGARGEGIRMAVVQTTTNPPTDSQSTPNQPAAAAGGNRKRRAAPSSTQRKSKRAAKPKEPTEPAGERKLEEIAQSSANALAWINDFKREMLQRFDDMRTREAQREEDCKKEEEYRKAVLFELRLFRSGRPSGAEPATRGPSKKEQAETAKEYIKLHICLDFMDDKGGKKLFSATTESLSDDPYLVKEAARFVLGSAATENDLAEFLNSTVSVRKGRKNQPQRVGVFIANGQNRAQDSIRTSMLNGFFESVPDYEEDVKKVRSINVSSDEKERAAKCVQAKDDLLNNISFEDAWKDAWLSARHGATTTALSSLAELQSFNPEASLPTMPQRDASERLNASIYSMGFIVMKLMKTIEDAAKKKTRTYRTTHEPYWAKYVLELDKMLKAKAGVVLPSSTNESVVGGSRTTAVENTTVTSSVCWGDLNVIGLLNEEERKTLEEKRYV